MKIWQKILIAVVSILPLAGLLRFSHLNAFPIFADEAIYVRWSQVMRAEPSLRFLPLTDGKQPLFMWATIPFLKLISDPLLAGRILSGLAGMGSVLGVGVAAYIIFKRLRIAAIAALLWATLPYAVFFERLALADSLLTLFLIWSFNLAALSLVHLRLDLAMLAGFSLGFAWLTKSPALFFLGLLPVLILLSDKSSWTKARLAKSTALLLTTYAIAFAMYNVLRLGPEFHQIALRNQDYVHPFSEVLRHPLDPLIPHLKDSLSFFLYLATPVGLLFALWGIFESHKGHLRQRLILTCFFLIPIFFQAFIAKGFTARYLFFTAPFATILMAHALEHIGQRTKKHALTFMGLTVIVASSLWVDSKLLLDPPSAPLPRIERAGYLEEWTSGYGLREVSTHLAQASASGPVLVGSEGFFGTPFNALELYLNPFKNIRIVGVGVSIDSADPKLTSALSDNQVFLVVNSSRFFTDPTDPELESKLGLKIIASYPKAVKPDGTREHLLFFQVVPRP